MMNTKRILLLGLITGALFAQNPITVSNVPGISADYNDLQVALDEAPANSTIYVYASTTAYGDISITKKVNLFGAGIYPDSPSLVTTKLGNVNFSISQSDSSHESTLCGFEFTSTITLAGGLRGISIERNKGRNIVLNQNYNISIINNYLSGSNIAYLRLIALGGSLNTNILNNYFYITYTSDSNIYAIDGGNAVIVNNDIYVNNPYNGGSYSHLMNVSNCIVENNIFRGDGNWASTNSTIFSNNLSVNPVPIGASSNSGSGNITGSPVYVSTSFGNPDYYGLDWGSPGIGAGTDGTNLGLQGGIFVFSNAYIPPLPYVQRLLVPTVVPQNGSVTIEIIGKSHN